MRRFLRWLVGVTVEAELHDRLLTAERRIDDLEDDRDHWERRFKKLQGQVTRNWREQEPEPEFEDEDEESEFNRLLEEKRRARG